MVNVTPEYVGAREIAFSVESWPVEEPGPNPTEPPVGKFTPPNDFVQEGAVFFPSIISPQDAKKRCPGVKVPGID